MQSSLGVGWLSRTVNLCVVATLILFSYVSIWGLHDQSSKVRVFQQKVPYVSSTHGWLTLLNCIGQRSIAFVCLEGAANWILVNISPALKFPANESGAIIQLRIAHRQVWEPLPSFVWTRKCYSLMNGHLRVNSSQFNIDPGPPQAEKSQMQPSWKATYSAK